MAAASPNTKSQHHFLGGITPCHLGRSFIPSHLESGLPIVLPTSPSLLRGSDFQGPEIPEVSEPSRLQGAGSSLELIALLGASRWPYPPGANTSSLAWARNTTAVLVLEFRHVY